MTPRQYDALQLILEDGERFRERDLNIMPQTMRAIRARGWIEDLPYGFVAVTDKGMAALGF